VRPSCCRRDRACRRRGWRMPACRSRWGP
jgi:hypothetical protein